MLLVHGYSKYRNNWNNFDPETNPWGEFELPWERAANSPEGDLEALNGWLRCRRRFFLFSEKWPHISGSPEFVGTLPLAPFFFRKMAPIFLEALNLWVHCRRRLFFSEKWPPYFWKPWICGYVAAGAFFFQKNDPIFWLRTLSQGSSNSPERQLFLFHLFRSLEY